jgi:HlyD family secretion protein
MSPEVIEGVEHQIEPARIATPSNLQAAPATDMRETPVALHARKTSKLKWFIGGTVIACLALGAWLLFRGKNEIEYRTAAVDRGDIEATVTSTGSPNAVVTVQVGSQVSGNISELDADFNSPVKKGQLVARIDPELFQAQVNQAQATLDAARAAVVNAKAGVARARADVAVANANVANAGANVLKAQVAVRDGKVKYDRRVPLAKEGVISPEDLDTAQATYNSAVAEEQVAEAMEQAAQENVNSAKASLDVAQTQLASAEAQVKQSQATLDQAQLNLDHTYIRAPVDGVVVSRNVDVGQTVAASLQAPTLFLIAQDLTKMQVDTNVSEADVGRVKLNQPATFTVDAYPGQIFRGEVWQIRQAAINVQNVITYDVVITVSNKDLKLFPGMTANVKILVDRHANALRMPNAALRFRPPEAALLADTQPGSGARRAAPVPMVWLLQKNGELKSVRVQTGLTDGTFTEVTGGDLKEGMQVVIAAFPRNPQSNGTTTTPVSSGGGRAPRI